MADKKDTDAVAVATESFKEGVKAAKKTGELETLKAENTRLEKLKGQMERAYNTAVERPNKLQLGIAVGTAALGVPGGFLANQYLERKSVTMIDKETGKKTATGKFVQHGIVPTVGVIGAVGCAFLKNGALSSAGMGFFAGLGVGSVVRSAFKVPLPPVEEAAEAP